MTFSPILKKNLVTIFFSLNSKLILPRYKCVLNLNGNNFKINVYSIIRIIADVDILFLCTYKTHTKEWIIIWKFFEQAFDIIHSSFVKSFSFIKNAVNGKLILKMHQKIILKIAQRKPCSDSLFYNNSSIY